MRDPIPVYNYSCSRKYEEWDNTSIYYKNDMIIYTMFVTIPEVKIYCVKNKNVKVQDGVFEENFNQTTNVCRIRVDKAEYVLDAENGNYILTRKEKEKVIKILKRNWDRIVFSTVAGNKNEYDRDLVFSGVMPDYSQLPTSD